MAVRGPRVGRIPIFDEVVEEFDDGVDIDEDGLDPPRDPIAPADPPLLGDGFEANDGALGGGGEGAGGGDAGGPRVPVAPSAAARVHVDHERSGFYLRRALGALGDLAALLCIILPQDDADAAALEDMGFMAVKRGGDLDLEGFAPEAALIVTVGIDEALAVQAVQLLNESDLPNLFVVIVMPHEDTDAPPSPRTCAEHIRSIRGVRSNLWDAGADQILCLMGGEALKAQRVMESIHQATYMAHKTSDIINAEVAAIQHTAMQRLNQAHHRFLMMMPGRALENLPTVDTPLQEWRDEHGTLIGAGDFSFITKLGSGAYAHVFKAEHPKHGICAVKVCSKRTMKNANVLVALHNELCQLLYAEAHPNIVRAHDVLHATNNFYVVMDYAGTHHLLKYTKNFLVTSGQQALPKEVVLSFARQEAAAIGHLHSHLVCHRDIKPDNWIVSDDGTTLRLADFGFSIRLSGPQHQLRHCCGSLPFCAPEVYRTMPLDFSASSGHDGLAADIWSLGMNYAEMLRGPYSLEHILGWVPQHPTDEETILCGLRSIVEKWAAIAPEEPPVISNTISNLLVLQPGDRWRIGKVLSSEGLCAGGDT